MTVRRDPDAVVILFAGAADGWGVGLQRAGYRIVALAESDPDRRAVLRKRHPEAVIYDDVRDVTAERLVRDLGYLPGVIVGSPPCQDISSANNGRAQGVDGARSGLYFEAIRIIGEVRPDWYALENSPFVKTRGYDRLHAALGAVGYPCWPSVVGAVHAGFFHLRKRSWLAGVDVPDAAKEPLGAAGQPWAGAPDAAHADADREQQSEGVVGEVGGWAGDSDPGRAADAHEVLAGTERGLRERLADPRLEAGGADADAGRANAGGRDAHRGRGAGPGAPAPGHADADESGCGGLARPDAGGWPEEASPQLPAGLAALEAAGRKLGLGGRTGLGEHYRMAHGFRARLVAAGVAAGLTHRKAVAAWTDHARACVSAYGDALVPDIAEAHGHAMRQLMAELRGAELHG